MTVTCHGAVPRSSGGSRAAAVRRSGGDASRVRATPPRSPTAARGRGTGRATRLPRNNFSNSISSPRGLESPHEDDQIQNGPRPAAARLRTAVTQRARMARAARVGHAPPSRAPHRAPPRVCVWSSGASEQSSIPYAWACNAILVADRSRTRLARVSSMFRAVATVARYGGVYWHCTHLHAAR